MNGGPVVRVHCETCGELHPISPMHPAFPHGPYYCAACKPKARREGATGRPDDEGGALAVDEETDETAIVIDWSGRFGK